MKGVDFLHMLIQFIITHYIIVNHLLACFAWFNLNHFNRLLRIRPKQVCNTSDLNEQKHTIFICIIWMWIMLHINAHPFSFSQLLIVITFVQHIWTIHWNDTRNLHQNLNLILMIIINYDDPLSFFLCVSALCLDNFLSSVKPFIFCCLIYSFSSLLKWIYELQFV